MRHDMDAPAARRLRQREHQILQRITRPHGALTIIGVIERPPGGRPGEQAARTTKTDTVGEFGSTRGRALEGLAIAVHVEQHILAQSRAGKGVGGVAGGDVIDTRHLPAARDEIADAGRQTRRRHSHPRPGEGQTGAAFGPEERGFARRRGGAPGGGDEERRLAGHAGTRIIPGASRAGESEAAAEEQTAPADDEGATGGVAAR